MISAFLKTGNLSRPPDSEHSSTLVEERHGWSLFRMSPQGWRIFWPFRKGVRQKDTWITTQQNILGLVWLKKKKNHLFFLGSSLFIYEMKRLYKISVLAWTAKTNYHSLGGLRNKHGFLSVLGKPKIKALVDLVSGVGILPGFLRCIFLYPPRWKSGILCHKGSIIP